MAITATRRRSSGVEHSIGNGEVDSSNLSGGTISLFMAHESLHALNGDALSPDALAVEFP